MGKIYLNVDTGKGQHLQVLGDSPIEQSRALKAARIYLRGGAREVTITDANRTLYEGSTDAGEAKQTQVQGFPPQSSDYDDGLTFVGDIGDDILGALKTTDRFVDNLIFGTPEGNAILDVLPYGPIIKAAHETRLSAMGVESATKRQAREAKEREAREAREAKATSEAATAEERRRASEEAGRQARDLDALIQEAQIVTRGARQGDKLARLRLIAVKTLAGEGDPKARRLWKVYTLIADEDQMRIEQGARSA